MINWREVRPMFYVILLMLASILLVVWLKFSNQTIVPKGAVHVFPTDEQLVTVENTPLATPIPENDEVTATHISLVTNPTLAIYQRQENLFAPQPSSEPVKNSFFDPLRYR